MRPSRQTMRHCCQLIPLQITPSFIVSSLASSLSPSFSLAFPPRDAGVSSLFLEPRLQTLSLLLRLYIFPCTFCFSLSLSLPLRVSFSIFLESFLFALCILPLSFSILRCSPLRCPLSTVFSRRGGLFFTAGRCTWDRGDKRNCANKYAPADNCSINRS